MFVCWSWQRTQLCQQMLSSLLVCRIQKRLGSLKPSTPFYKLCIIYIGIHRAAQVARMIQDAIPESASVHWTCLLCQLLAFDASALYHCICFCGKLCIRQIKTGKDFRESDNLGRNVHLRSTGGHGLIGCHSRLFFSSARIFAISSCTSLRINAIISSVNSAILLVTPSNAMTHTSVALHTASLWSFVPPLAHSRFVC